MTPVQHIAITLSDGSLAVMQFVIADRDATDDAINAEIAKGGLQATGWRRIEVTDLPADRTYRDAWTDNGKSIAVDPIKQAALDQAAASIVTVDTLQAALVSKGVLTDADVTAAATVLAETTVAPAA